MRGQFMQCRHPVAECQHGPSGHVPEHRRQRQPVRPVGVDPHEFDGHVHVADAHALDLLGNHHVVHGVGGEREDAPEDHPDGGGHRRHGEGGQAGDHAGHGHQRLGERRHRALGGLERHHGRGHRLGRHHEEDLHRDGDAGARHHLVGDADAAGLDHRIWAGLHKCRIR